MKTKTKRFRRFNSWSKCLPLMVFTLFSISVLNPSLGQQSLRIAATVNDEMVSVLDLQTRISLVAAFAGFENSPETQQRLAPQVIQSLINERIRMQEAKRLEITAKKGELDAEKAAVASQIKIDPAQLDRFLENSGIDPTTLSDQLEAKIVWTKIVRGKYGSAVRISDNEVDELIEEIKNNKGKAEYLTSEIYLPAESTEQIKSATELASRLVQQIQGGANFSAVAQNFSQSPTAQTGGNMGWNQGSQLNAEIRSIVQGLEPGQVSPPHRTSDGIYVIQLRAQRVSRGLEGPPPGPASVTLHQLHLAANAQSSPAQLEALKTRAQSITANVQGCQALDAVTKQFGSPLSGELGTFEIDQISQQMRKTVENLPVGKSSLPQFIGDGIVVLMVCARDVPEAEPVDLEKIRSNLRGQLVARQLLLSSRRYLRDLRRAAFIDIRL